MYPLFESIKVVDGNLINLEWHQQRVDNSRQKIFGKVNNLMLKALLEVPEEFAKGVVKCRMSYGITMGAPSYSNYTKKDLTTLQLVECAAFDYSFKYEDRITLDRLYQQRGACDEVLITFDGMVTDTSYSNVALYDGTHWYTPEQPLLEGTQRAKLLASGMVKKMRIHMTDLANFEKLVLINALLEFQPQEYIRITDIKPWDNLGY